MEVYKMRVKHRKIRKEVTYLGNLFSHFLVLHVVVMTTQFVVGILSAA